MSRNAAARELQRAIEDLQERLDRADALARASGGLVDKRWFRGARGMVTMAAGDLHSAGLWTEPELVIPPTERVDG